MGDYLMRDGAVYVLEHPRWLEQGMDVQLSIRYYNALTKFYVVGSPVPGLSARQLDLKGLGWSSPWSKPEYLNRKMKDKATTSDFLWSVGAYGRMGDCLRNAGMLDGWLSRATLQECVVLYNCKNNQMLSLLFHLRNALCHGRFAFFKHKRAIWVALEDVNVSRGRSSVEGWVRLSARMILRHSTLLAWQELILGGPKVRMVNECTWEQKRR